MDLGAPSVSSCMAQRSLQGLGILSLLSLSPPSKSSHGRHLDVRMGVSRVPGPRVRVHVCVSTVSLKLRLCTLFVL